MAKANVLLVQNAQTQGNGTKRHLEGAGYAVVWTGSGVSALAAAKQRAVDVIVVDVALPDIEGGDLCRRLRSQDSTQDVPIILLAPRGYDPHPPKEKNGGPDAILAKPYAETDLDGKIVEVMRVRTAAAGPRDVSISPGMGHSVVSEKEVIDPVTGLFGKRQFQAMFSKEFKRSVRFKQQMSCMMIDLDGKTMGRPADVSTLRSIVGLVQRTIREVDTAAWWSGEALIVLLPNTLRRDAVQAAVRILETVANHPFSWSDATKVTMSIGVAGMPDPKVDSEQKLIDAATAACPRAREIMLPMPNQSDRSAR
jgi:diguanylate cyclase (GGDEF)-like protein